MKYPYSVKLPSTLIAYVRPKYQTDLTIWSRCGLLKLTKLGAGNGLLCEGTTPSRPCTLVDYLWVIMSYGINLISLEIQNIMRVILQTTFPYFRQWKCWNFLLTFHPTLLIWVQFVSKKEIVNTYCHQILHCWFFEVEVVEQVICSHFQLRHFSWRFLLPFTWFCN